MVNTPRGRGPRADGAHIRAAAGRHQVPLLTTAAAGLAAANGMADWAATRCRCGRCRSTTGASATTRPSCRSPRRDPTRPPPARGRRRSGRPDHPVGSVAPGQPGDDRVGHRRPRRRAGRLRRPGLARRGRGQVAVGRAVGRQPGAAGARDPGRDDQQRRAPGPGRGRLARPTSCRRCWPPGRVVVASIWGTHGRGLRAGGRAAGRRAARGGGGRGQRVVPQPPRPRPHVRPLADRPRPRRCRRRRSAAGRCGPSSAPTSPTSSPIAAAAAEAGAEAVTLVNTVLGMAIDLETAPAPAGRRRRRALGSGHPPGRRAGGLRRPPRPARPAHRRRRGRGHRRRRGRADAGRRVGGAGGHGHLRRPPQPSSGCATSWRTGAGPTGSGPSVS